MWWKVASLAAPFVSAFLAAWVTYVLSRRKSRSDKFLEGRTSALSQVYAELVAIKLYAEKSYNLEVGNEYAPHPETELVSNSLLVSLWEKVEEFGIFLSTDEQDAIGRLIQELNMCKSMERAIFTDPDIRKESNASEMYENISSLANEAANVLYSEFRKAYGI